MGWNGSDRRGNSTLVKPKGKYPPSEASFAKQSGYRGAKKPSPVRGIVAGAVVVVLAAVAYFAFFSGSDLTQEQLDALIERCHALGTRVVGITLGSRGALFSEEGKRYEQGIVRVEAIDTMGAGDSFIAGFLTRRILGDNMEDALRFAAGVAAKTCQVRGSFGYPHAL